MRLAWNSTCVTQVMEKQEEIGCFHLDVVKDAGKRGSTAEHTGTIR